MTKQSILPLPHYGLLRRRRRVTRAIFHVVDRHAVDRARHRRTDEHARHGHFGAARRRRLVCRPWRARSWSIMLPRDPLGQRLAAASRAEEFALPAPFDELDAGTRARIKLVNCGRGLLCEPEPNALPRWPRSNIDGLRTRRIAVRAATFVFLQCHRVNQLPVEFR